MKHDAIQVRHAVVQFRLAVLVEKVAGISQTGCQNPLVADDNQLHILDVHIGWREKAWQQDPFSIDDREKPLMLFHGGNQRFRGDGKISFIKGPAENIGTLQGKDRLVEEFFLVGRIHLSVDRTGKLFELRGQCFPSLGRIDHHAPTSQSRFI